MYKRQAVVLAGYLAALAGTSAGQGFRLAAHLFGSPHGAVADAPDVKAGERDTPDASGVARVEKRPHDAHEAAHAHGGTHRHGAGHRHAVPAVDPAERHAAGAHGHAEAPAGAHDGAHDLADAPAGHGSAAGPEAFHEHAGRVHSHREQAPPPPLLTVALDKHCFFPGALVPSPLPARGLDPVGPGAAHAPVVLPVEVRPPRGRA